MNHLAHLFLSRNFDKLMVGNFIADGVKGRKYLDFEEEISRGILMHRAIDSFTDSNAIVRRSKRFFRERYGLFSSLIIDVFYDHFLARNWSEYSGEPLPVFAGRAYGVLGEYHHMMPPRFQHMLPYMQKENWLLSYAQLDGIRRSLTGMSRRIANHPGIDHAPDELVQHYREIEYDFKEYFPLLQRHVEPWTNPA